MAQAAEVVLPALLFCLVFGLSVTVPLHTRSLQFLSSVFLRVCARVSCEVDVASFKARLRQPTGVVLGLGAQFVVMPCGGFLLARLAQLDRPLFVGFVLTTSAPGGACAAPRTFALSHFSIVAQ